MKARIKFKNKLSSKQRADIEAYAREVHQNEAVNNARRLIKIVCVALNQRFGFGHDRLAVLLGEIDSLAEKQKEDLVFWYHMDKECIKYLNLPFEPEDYEKMGE
ncbi:MAG: hypothetical protein U0M02_13945 [Acutalibacteraceae bacterium]|nr:hypothetical protein [Acutalibacteraceae bacterium]